MWALCRTSSRRSESSLLSRRLRAWMSRAALSAMSPVAGFALESLRARSPPRQPRRACGVPRGDGKKATAISLERGERRGIRNAFARRRRARGAARARRESARTSRTPSRDPPRVESHRGRANPASRATEPPRAGRGRGLVILLCRPAKRGRRSARVWGRTVRLRAVRVTCARRLVRRFARTTTRPNVFAGVRSAPRSGAARRASGARTRAMQQTGTVRPKDGKN